MPKRKTKTRAKRKGWKMPEETEIAMIDLLRRIEVVGFTASTVMSALYSQDMGRDREIGVCVEEHIADALDHIVDDGAALLGKYRSEPYKPLLKSILLGMRHGRRLARSQ